MTDRRVVLHPDPEAILAPIRAVGMGALIGIDGDLGTTKSSFADHLTHALGWPPAVHLDDSFAGDGSWHDPVRIARMLAERRGCGGPVVVEGVCLLASVPRSDLALMLCLHAPWEPGGSRLGRTQQRVAAYLREQRPEEVSDLVLDVVVADGTATYTRRV